MLRSLARAVATNHRCHATFSSLSHSSRPPKPTPPFKPDPKKPTAAAAVALFDDQERRRQLDADDKNPSLDVGPKGRPLFSAVPSLSHLSRNDVCTYFKLTYSPLLTLFVLFFVVAFCRTPCVRLLVWRFFRTLRSWVGLVLQEGCPEQGFARGIASGYGQRVSGLPANGFACSPELLGSSW